MSCLHSSYVSHQQAHPPESMEQAMAMLTCLSRSITAGDALVISLAALLFSPAQHPSICSPPVPSTYTAPPPTPSLAVPQAVSQTQDPNPLCNAADMNGCADVPSLKAGSSPLLDLAPSFCLFLLELMDCLLTHGGVEIPHCYLSAGESNTVEHAAGAPSEPGYSMSAVFLELWTKLQRLCTAPSQLISAILVCFFAIAVFDFLRSIISWPLAVKD